MTTVTVTIAMSMAPFIETIEAASGSTNQMAVRMATGMHGNKVEVFWGGGTV